MSQLQNEEESGEPEQAAGDAPPPYSSISAESAAYFDYKDESGFPKPPSYNVATTLPSYDEAERTKAEATIPLVPGRDEDFVGRDDFDDADQLRIGNDGIFMLTFFMAFLFNWIGFFLSFCLTTSAAGRYGAISGFGLSLIKWILIVRCERGRGLISHQKARIFGCLTESSILKPLLTMASVPEDDIQKEPFKPNHSSLPLNPRTV
ncbi:NEDD4 -interacting protein 1 [Saguinus oedipus]|uniref:NEDD4 -interacting protein 1 n=1 Tax=Saguinus oedipus TaxID=9490 RepID=A0ABQ9W8L3_SAGOE|nr:NEDD4 -interacting protein 1 [Saguinus oedipus]